jgi:hypothetical protein
MEQVFSMTTFSACNIMHNGKLSLAKPCSSMLDMTAVVDETNVIT